MCKLFLATWALLFYKIHFYCVSWDIYININYILKHTAVNFNTNLLIKTVTFSYQELLLILNCLMNINILKQ